MNIPFYHFLNAPVGVKPKCLASRSEKVGDQERQRGRSKVGGEAYPPNPMLADEDCFLR